MSLLRVPDALPPRGGGWAKLYIDARALSILSGRQPLLRDVPFTRTFSNLDMGLIVEASFLLLLTCGCSIHWTT